MKKARLSVFFGALLISAATVPALLGPAQDAGDNGGQIEGLIAGRNVNMVSGTRLPDGDPWLQRQNEPSMAVSTRNPLHLLAGANDYRTVDVPFSEGELPGLANAAAGDAWLGLFKSFDGGASWKTSLLPGFPQDLSPEGKASPIKKFTTAADPIVRAGTNGLFYYSGMAFNRAQGRGGGSLFLARFIDNNNVEGGDSIKYLDTKIIVEGNAGNFIDMPRIAVDVPRGTGTVTIDGQAIPRSSIYAVYTVFVGNTDVNVRSQIWFRRSTDCGQTWGPALKITDGQHIIQGATIAIHPNSGAVYVAYRRFQHPSQPDAMVIVRSTDFGRTFTSPAAIATVNPFDQPTTEDWTAPPFGTSFRTNSYPTMTVDDKGIVYVAWTERGWGPAQEARIVLYTSQGGTSWVGPRFVDNGPDTGHQFMPFLTFAAGKLTMVWYDQRDSAAVHVSGVDHWVSDGGLVRQTIDVRAAQANPGPVPAFEPSIQVSRYLWALYDDGTIQQVQYNPPNYPLFKGGTAPFLGDYIEVTPSPMFVKGDDGTWKFNTAPTSAPVFHIVWADNRDVRPPDDGVNWGDYTPPASDQGVFGTQGCLDVNIPGMGMRNQNIYTATLTRGVIAAAPANTKPLGTGLGYYPGTGDPVQRSFVIFAKNPTEVMKSFRLSIESPPAHGTASFLEFESLSSLDVVITAFSTIARTVFARSPDERDTLTIRVVEINWDGYVVPGGLTGEIVLNPDPTAPQIDPATDEVHNPNIRNSQIINWTEVPSPNIRNPNIVNPNIINELIVNPNIVNPNIVNPNIRNPNIVNPNIVNPNIRNPNIRNANIINPNIVNPNIRNDSLEGAEIYDVTATVVNAGNTTTSYTLKTYAKEALPEDVYLQLLVYKTYYTPAADTDGESGSEACLLKVERHDELVLNIANPNIRNPNIVNPNIRNPNIRNESVENATFALAPGEEAEVMVRIIRPAETSQSAPVRSLKTMSLQNDVGVSQYFDIETFAESIGFAATSQAVNTKEARDEGVTTPPAAASKLIIGTGSLPDGAVGNLYSTTLVAYGGDELFWTLNSGELPPGLTLGSDGTISGFPTAEGFYRFVVRVDDRRGDFDTQRYSIYIAADATTPVPLTIVTTSLPSGVLDYWYGATLEATGGAWPRTWSLSDGALPPGLELDSEGVISGTVRREAGRLYPATYDFSVSVVDQDGGSATRGLNITVNERTGASYTISGTVYDGSGDPLEGVVMRGLPNTPVTGSSGYYQDTVPEFWSGTVIPNKKGYAFVPESRSYTDLASDRPYEDYHVGTSPALTISGRVTLGDAGLAGVVMSGLPVQVVTGVDGYYSAAVNFGWSGTVTPVLAGYTFTPPSLTYSDVTMDQTGQDYSATAVAPPVADWVVRYNGPGNGLDAPRAVAVDPSGDVIVAGWSLGSGTFFDYATIKYDRAGATRWVRRYGNETGSVDRAWAMAVDALGNVYVTGESTADGADTDYATVKYDAAGEVQWVRRYNGPESSSDEAKAIAVDASGNVYVTGFSLGGASGADYATIKYDASGTEQWVRRYNGPGNVWDEAAAVAVDPSGNVFVTGRSHGSGTDADYATIKYDRSGAEQWVRRHNGPANGADWADSLAVDRHGHVYVTGRSFGSGAVTVKYDAAGEVQWVAAFENNTDIWWDWAYSVAVDASGNVYITGLGWAQGTWADFATIKYDSSGAEQWVANYNGTMNSDDIAVGITLDPLGNVYVTGRSYGSGTDLDYVTIKYDGSGAEQWTSTYNGPANSLDEPTAIALDPLGNIYVTGLSYGIGTDVDYATIRYGQSFPSTLVIATEVLDIAYEGVPYAKALWAFGGGGTRTWTVTEGSLPPGLELVPSTGIIEGTVAPSSPGIYSFRVRVQDGSLTAEKDLNIMTSILTYVNYSITGTVTLGGSPLAGAVMSGLPGDPVTDVDGNYGVSVSSGWSGTVTPILAGYSFNPANRSYSGVSSNLDGQDYVATFLGGGVYFTVQPSDAQADQPISPNVRVKILGDDGAPLPGISVTVSIENNAGGGSLSGGTSTVTNASGDATFMDLSISAPGSGYTLRVAAALTGYGWSNYAISIPFNIL